MKITLHQLQIFREVMQTGSMSTAARNLNKTQPAVSLTLKGLETTVGFPLFARANRKLIPVPEAQYLFAEADSVLNQVAKVQRNLERFGLGDEGTVQIAGMPGFSMALLPEFLANYTANKPNVNVSLLTRSSAQLQELVGSQSIDIGMGDFSDEGARSPRTSTIMISGLCFVAVAANSTLAKLNTIAPHNLSSAVMGGMQLDHPFMHRLNQKFIDLPKPPVFRHASQTILPLLQFVAKDQCAVVVDPLTVATVQTLKLFQQEVEFKPFDSNLRYEYALVSPNFRPTSVLTNEMKHAWLHHVETLIQGLHAAPEVVDFNK